MTTQTAATDLSNANPATPVVVPPAVPTLLQDTQTAIKVEQLLQLVKLLNPYLLGGLLASVIFNFEIINGEGADTDRMLTYALVSVVLGFILKIVDMRLATVLIGASTYALLGSTMTEYFGADPYKFNYVGFGITVSAWISWMIIQSQLEEAIKPTPPPSAS